MKILASILIAGWLSLVPAGWTKTNLPLALPLPVTNTLPVAVSVTNTRSLPPQAVSAAMIEISQLARAMAGADAGTRNQVSRAIQAIQDGHRAEGRRELAKLQEQRRLSPAQERAIAAAQAELE